MVEVVMVEVVVEEAVFTRENRAGTAQQATRATPTQTAVRRVPSPVTSLSAAFIHVTLPAPSRVGRTRPSVQSRRDHFLPHARGTHNTHCLSCDCSDAVCLR